MVSHNTFQRKLEELGDKPVGLELSRFFLDELYKAIEHGRIMTKDRIKKLWPIINEINSEQRRMRQGKVHRKLQGVV